MKEFGSVGTSGPQMGIILCPAAQSFSISNKSDGVSEVWRSEKHCRFYCIDKTVDSCNCWNKWCVAYGANSRRPLQGHDFGSADPSHDPFSCFGRIHSPTHTHFFSGGSLLRHAALPLYCSAALLLCWCPTELNPSSCPASWSGRLIFSQRCLADNSVKLNWYSASSAKKSFLV